MTVSVNDVVGCSLILVGFIGLVGWRTLVAGRRSARYLAGLAVRRARIDEDIAWALYRHECEAYAIAIMLSRASAVTAQDLAELLMAGRERHLSVVA